MCRANRGVRVAAVVTGAVLTGTFSFAQTPPEPAAKAKGAVPAPAFSETVLELTPAVLDRLAKALAAEEESRRSSAAAAGPTAGAQKTKQEYDECQQSLMKGPEYAQLLQEYPGATTGRSKDASAREAAQEFMTKLAALTEKTCGPDPAHTREKQDLARRLREAETKAAERGGFTIRQYAVLKERVTPLCLSDPVPPSPDGLRIKGVGSASFVYTAAEVAALRPRCDVFIKLLYPDQN